MPRFSSIHVPERFRGGPLIGLSSALFAVMALFARMLAGRLPTAELALLRFLVGIGCMGAYYLRVGKRPDVPRPVPWLLRGVLGGAAVYFYFLAIDQMAVGPATVLNYSAPIYAGLLGAMFLRERLTRFLVLGIAVAWTGSLLVATGSSGGHFSVGYGAACGLVSAVLAGAATVAIRSLRSDTSAGSIFFSFCLFGALIALPFCAHGWVPLTRETFALALAVGLSSVAAQLLFTYAFRYVSAARGSAINQLTSVFTWLLGVAVLHEGVGALALFGAALCIAGVALGAWPARPRSAPQPVALPEGAPNPAR